MIKSHLTERNVGVKSPLRVKSAVRGDVGVKSPILVLCHVTAFIFNFNVGALFVDSAVGVNVNVELVLALILA